MDNYQFGQGPRLEDFDQGPTLNDKVVVTICMCADNDLTNDGKEDILEVIRGTDGCPEIEVALLFDGKEDRDSRRFLIRNGDIVVNEKLKEINSNDPQTLTDLLLWSNEITQQKTNVFVLAGHGDGECTGTDETITNKFPNTGFTPLQIQRAIFRSGIVPDVLALDACKTADAFSFATMMAPGIKAIVGSPDIVPGCGVRHDVFLSQLLSIMSAKTIAALYIDSYDDESLLIEKDTATLVAFNSEIRNVLPVLVDIAKVAGIEILKKKVRDFEFYQDSNLADIWNFASVLNDDHYATTLQKAVSESLIHYRNITPEQSRVGLNFWLPREYTNPETLKQLSISFQWPPEWFQILYEINENYRKFFINIL
jgi:hypothetical protein